MKYKKTNKGYIIKIERGEKVIETLTKFCNEQNVVNGWISGLGAVSSAEFGHYDLTEKEYALKVYNQMMEVVSMTGNVVLLDGKPFLHVHCVFSDTENKAYGGHVKEMTVRVVLEVLLISSDSTVKRTLDEDIGLRLFDFT